MSNKFESSFIIFVISFLSGAVCAAANRTIRQQQHLKYMNLYWDVGAARCCLGTCRKKNDRKPNENISYVINPSVFEETLV